ncbi:MAG: hypothetical protein ABI551_20095 [Polyangiaceae bacterium]
MKTCEYDGVPFATARAHPWTDAVSNSTFRYYDLKKEPARIRTSLEDFLPWKSYAAIDRFFGLLEAINGARSRLESNDCAFTGPSPNESPSIPQAMQCTGRVMVLFRDLARNLSAGDVFTLKNSLHEGLSRLDPELDWAMIGTTLVPVDYVTLPIHRDRQQGQELMISFWAWGSSEVEVMENLDRLMKNLTTAFARIHDELNA